MARQVTLRRPAPTVVIRLPLLTVSESNQRDHWAVKAKRAKEQRALAALMVRRELGNTPSPRTVSLTRQGSRLLDSDNLQGSFKAVRDGIADALGVDDSERGGIDWRYAQEKVGRKETGTIVEIVW